MIIETAPAKINLALHVRSRRDDGYHEIETLFAFLKDGDIIRLKRSDKSSFSVSGPFAAALSGEGDNLVTRAASRFAETFAIDGAYAIELEKHLPVASGIGGGSADAAATLRALARLHGMAPDDQRLFAIAEGLGADVPACLLGRSAVGVGKGEKLTPIGGLTDMPVLLVNPGVGVSTGAVFKGWGGADLGSISAGSLIDRALAGRNDLEAPARAVAPVIGKVVSMLAAGPGTLLARMSGSGATCFALYESVTARQAAAQAIRAQQPEWWLLESALT